MKWRVLSVLTRLKEKRVLLRLDWNIALPITKAKEEDLVKLEESVKTIESLRRRGAKVIIFTHLGRPKEKDPAYSTRVLAMLITKKFGLPVIFHPESIGNTKQRERLGKAIQASGAGTVHLLENVRFEKGEETNDQSLAKQYASLADLFINDAFASSHRAHASVAGIAKCLPAYAGPQVMKEVRSLEQLLHPRKPMVAIVGGLKISTKIDLLKKLLSLCETVCVGGAMATTLLVAQGKKVGASFVEKDVIAHIKKIARAKNLSLPLDVRVARHATISIEDIKSGDVILDIGPETLNRWRHQLKKARTIIWNGPVGKIEETPYAKGTEQLARIIAQMSGAFSVVGGGDTVPLIFKKNLGQGFDHVSLGGGAMLEFLVKGGRLPGLVPLLKR